MERLIDETVRGGPKNAMKSGLSFFHLEIEMGAVRADLGIVDRQHQSPSVRLGNPAGERESEPKSERRSFSGFTIKPLKHTLG